MHVNPVPAGILGRITGQVGGRHQGFERVAGAVDVDHADADPQVEHLGSPGKPMIANGIPKIVRDLHRAGAAAVHQQHTELVSPEARHDVAPAHAGANQLRDLAQQFISRTVTAGVVDRLELIQVEIQKCVNLAVHRPLNETFQVPVEFPAVDEARQGIVAGLVGQLILEAPLLAYVMKNHDDSVRPPPGIGQRGHGFLHRDPPPVPGDKHDLLFPACPSITLQLALQRIAEANSVRFVDQLYRLGKRFSPGVPQRCSCQRLGHGVHVGNPAIPVRGDHRIGNGPKRNERALAGRQ